MVIGLILKIVEFQVGPIWVDLLFHNSCIYL